MQIEAFERAMDSVRKPIQHFIDTGFWDPYVDLEAVNYLSDISEVQVRRSCRTVARELGRPFIVCYQVRVLSWIERSKGKVPVKKDWSYGWVQMPKRKKLMPLVTPLLLAGTKEKDAKVCDGSTIGIWRFSIMDQEFWNEYYHHILSDPDCRNARGLSPLT